MKIRLDKQSILPILTFIALFALLIIQFSYINRAASLDEQNFNHRAVLALTDTRDEVTRRIPTCNNMESFFSGNYCPKAQKEAAAEEVDSILQSYLSIYQIDLAFKFELIDTKLISKNRHVNAPTCYLQKLNGILNNKGIHMKLEFPDRNQFLRKQITSLFLLSILFIGFILTSFILTHQLFRREKTQKQQTHDFIDNMVHEFQTPIANIKFATNLLKKKIPQEACSDKMLDYTNVLTLESEKLESHVQAILNVACSSKKQCPCEVLDIHEVIKTVSDQYNFRILQDGGQLLLNLNANTTDLYGDREQLLLAVSNMIDNALKYSKGSPEITITTSNTKDTIQIEIGDKGIGIDKKDIDFIFDKYFRVSTGDVHDIKGFGLGLSYVKKIIERYNGHISVKSQINEGTQFLIRLPISQ